MFVAIRDALIRSLRFDDPIEGLRFLDINYFELAVDKTISCPFFYNLNLTREEDISKLKEILEKENLKICAILLMNDFGEKKVEREIEYLVRGIKIAQELKVPVVRINAVMKLDYVRTIENALLVTIKCINSALKQANQNIWLAVENHGIVSNRVEFLRELFAQLKDKKVGLTLDTCNFYWYGYPLSKLYEIYQEFAHLVKHTHIKNAIAKDSRKNETRKPQEVIMTPLYEGDIELDKVIQILKNANYNYDLTIEDESLSRYTIDKRRDIVKKDRKYLEEILESL